VICMVGRTPKGFLGIQEDQKGSKGEFEPMCSPITQTKILNEVATSGATVVPVALGAAETCGKVDGKKLITAVVIGAMRIEQNSPMDTLLKRPAREPRN